MSADALIGLTTSFATWLLYVALAYTVGTLLCRFLFGVEEPALRLASGAAGGAALSGLVFTLVAASLTGGWAGLFDREIHALLWNGPNGTTLGFRLVGFALIIPGLFAGRHGQWVSLAGAALVLWSFGQQGHIADRDNVLLAIGLLLHLSVMCVWLGVLMPLRRLACQTDCTNAADLGERFARFAVWAVPALLLAGLAMSVELLGSVAALFDTAYGRLLGLKVVAVASLLLIAAINKQRLVPRVRGGDDGARVRLVRALTLEAFLGLAILGATALLTTRFTVPT